MDSNFHVPQIPKAVLFSAHVKVLGLEIIILKVEILYFYVNVMYIYIYILNIIYTCIQNPHKNNQKPTSGDHIQLTPGGDNTKAAIGQLVLENQEWPYSRYC